MIEEEEEKSFCFVSVGLKLLYTLLQQIMALENTPLSYSYEAVYRPGKKSNGRVGTGLIAGSLPPLMYIPSQCSLVYNEDENGYLPSVFYALLLDDHARRGYHHQTL